MEEELRTLLQKTLHQHIAPVLCPSMCSRSYVLLQEKPLPFVACGLPGTGVSDRTEQGQSWAVSTQGRDWYPAPWGHGPQSCSLQFPSLLTRSKVWLGPQSLSSDPQTHPQGCRAMERLGEQALGRVHGWLVPSCRLALSAQAFDPQVRRWEPCPSLLSFPSATWEQGSRNFSERPGPLTDSENCLLRT